eukprot:m.5682 g.5682  ORF g.5682 m.5682 type:complete len:171 (-) comp2452_c0_seq1:307-819(-)
MLSKWQLNDPRRFGSTQLSKGKESSPPGFSGPNLKTDLANKGLNATSAAELKNKIAWNMVTKALGQLPMNLFMMYMMGNTVQLITFFMLTYMISGPIAALSNMNKEFEKISREESFTLQKLAFIGAQLGVMGLAAWKCSGLGLIPTTQADWLEFLPFIEPREFSSGSVAL